MPRHNERNGSGDGTDAIVVGAGPGGAVTALLLARQGVRVTLVDRAGFPRPKPCGDCLSAAATDLLERLGLLDRVAGSVHAWLDGWTVRSPGGRAATGRFVPRRGLAIERLVLDAILRDAAIDAGARPRTARVLGLVREPVGGRVRGVLQRGTAGEESCGARLVVGADGLRSVVARSLGTVRRRPRTHKVSLTAHVFDPAPSRLGRMHVLDGGCVGVAPIGAGRANVTLVVDRPHAAGLRESTPAAFMRAWLERVPEPVAEAVPDGGEILASGPFDWPSRGAVADGAALVGDAAGYFDPFTGQGVYQAMAAAEVLAREAGPVLRDGGDDAALDHALARYARAHHRLTRPARRVQRLIETVLSRPGLADSAIARLGRAPAAMDRLIEVTGDVRAPATLLSPPLLWSFLTA